MKRLTAYLPLDKQSGFTLVELMISMVILVSLVSLITMNLVHTQRQSSLAATTAQLLGDIKSQQLKAMVGDTEGRGASDYYGIYLESTKYTLFHGLVYNPSDSTNFSVTLDPSLQFTTTNVSIIFNKISGDIVSFSGTTLPITLKDSTNNTQETIQLNQLGVITQIN